jgi:hypothetical protein
MSRAFVSIQQGLNEAISHAKSKSQKPKGVKLYQVQALELSSERERLSLRQENFAAPAAASRPRAKPNRTKQRV